MNNLRLKPPISFVPLFPSRVCGGLDHGWIDGWMSLIYHCIYPDFKEEFTRGVHNFKRLFQVSLCWERMLALLSWFLSSS